MSAWTYTVSNEANLFKIKYGKLIDKQFNEANVLFGRVKRKTDFVGKQLDRPIIQSIGGGVGAGSLPTANESKIANASISSIKKLYAVVSIDRETMKAARTDEGSFVRFTNFPVQIATRSFNRNLERMMTRGDATGTGALFTGNACNSVVTGAGTACSPYLVDFDVASTYFPAEFEQIEEGDILHVNTETTDLVVDSVTITDADGYATGTIGLIGTSSRLAALAACCGTAFGATDKLYMQNSKDNEMLGLKGVLSATSGTIYGVTVGRRWQSYNKSAASASISTDLLNDVMINVKRKSGESPNLILAPYHQYKKILDILEDQKRYPLPARDPRFKGQISFSGLEFMSIDGPVPIVPSRFMNSDEIYFLNDKYLELCLRSEFEWFDEDGNVFLRETTDSYEARYGGYGEFYINPHFHGRLHTLAV